MSTLIYDLNNISPMGNGYVLLTFAGKPSKEDGCTWRGSGSRGFWLKSSNSLIIPFFPSSVYVCYLSLSICLCVRYHCVMWYMFVSGTLACLLNFCVNPWCCRFLRKRYKSMSENLRIPAMSSAS